MRNQVQRDSSYPGERGVRVHRGVAQGRDSEKGKRNRIEKKTKRQAAGQEGSIVIEEFSESLSDDLDNPYLTRRGLHHTTPSNPILRNSPNWGGWQNKSAVCDRALCAIPASPGPGVYCSE